MSKIVIANYDYVSDDDISDCLEFEKGDKITVLHEDNESGWWLGTLHKNNETGYFPSTFVSLLDNIRYELQNEMESISLSSKSIKPISISHSPINIDIDNDDNDDSESKQQQQKEDNNMNIIDASTENYYSADVLNLKINPNAKTRYGLTSHYMSIFAAISTIFCAVSSYFWSYGSEYLLKYNMMINMYYNWCLLVGFYGFGIGIIMCLFEYFYGYYTRSKYSYLFRSFLYLFIGLPLFCTLPTGLCGILWLNASLFSYFAWKKGEIYEKKSKKTEKHGRCLCIAACIKIISIRKQSKVKKYLFMVIYLLLNILYTLYWSYYYYLYVDLANNAAKNGEPVGNFTADQLTLISGENGSGHYILNYWFSMAKGFGNLLDINCAFILFPVCRSFISKLYDISTDQRLMAKCFNFILSFMPLDKAIQFHKLCAFLIVIGTIFHSFAHFNQIASVPSTYEHVYGLTVWISGCLIIIIMQFIYCTSFISVRTGKYELFWYTHHLYIIFFILCLLHGKNSINPNFWKWFVIPGTLYMIERTMRELKGRHAVGVVSVSFMNTKKVKVFCLELEKTGPIRNHKEGAYVFIKCPMISSFQWHPFTISSPPNQKTLQLHIRNMGDGTWTDRLQQYFESMAPNKAYLELYHRDGNILVPQKLGPDGNNLICIDGPMAAPTQHLGEYSTSIIIGAGIGVTPVRSTLQSIIYFRFKRGVGCSYPDNAYCVWIVNYKQLDAYRFMCRTLKEAEDELFNMKATNPNEMKSKSLKIHIFVTSTPKTDDEWKQNEFKMEDVENLENDKQKDFALWGTHYDNINDKESYSEKRVNAPFNEIDIWKCLKNPTDDTIQIGDILIHKGRPKWNEFFQPIQTKYEGNKIGVMYCGPEIIAKDLKKTCGKYTNFKTKTVFVLHKENF